MKILMKLPIKYVYIASAIVIILVYGYFTWPASEESSRLLISKANLKGVKVSTADVNLSKEEAYEIKLQEQKAMDAKIEKALDNEDPQKLAGSLNQAMSDYEMKVEQLKANRQTVPYYDGKAFSVSDVSKDEPASSLTAGEDVFTVPQVGPQPTTERRKRVPVQPKGDKAKIISEVHTNPESEERPKEEQIFNTYSYEVSNGLSKELSPASLTVCNSEMVKAAVFGDQIVKSGSLLTFRLLEQALIEGTLFERNTTFLGKCGFDENQLSVVVDAIQLPDGRYKKVKMTLRDGINAPADKPKEATFDAAESSVENILQTAAPTSLGLGSAAAKVFRSAVGGSPAIRVPDGISVVFLIGEE